MATRSYLIAQDPAPQARLIYCHLNSQTFNLGLTLNRHYRRPERALPLLRRGNAVSIGATIATSIFAEDGEEHLYPSVREALTAVRNGLWPGIEYVYIYREETLDWAVIFPLRDGLTEPAPVSPEIIAEDLIRKINPHFHQEALDRLAQRDPETARQTAIHIARRLNEIR